VSAGNRQVLATSAIIVPSRREEQASGADRSRVTVKGTPDASGAGGTGTKKRMRAKTEAESKLGEVCLLPAGSAGPSGRAALTTLRTFQGVYDAAVRLVVDCVKRHPAVLGASDDVAVRLAPALLHKLMRITRLAREDLVAAEGASRGSLERAARRLIREARPPRAPALRAVQACAQPRSAALSAARGGERAQELLQGNTVHAGLIRVLGVREIKSLGEAAAAAVAGGHWSCAEQVVGELGSENERLAFVVPPQSPNL